MKKSATFILALFLLLLTGCRTFYIDAEVGSKWACEDPAFSFTIINGAYAEGTLIKDGESIDVECHFGPGVAEFNVYRLGDNNGDAWLIRGTCRYNARKKRSRLPWTKDWLMCTQARSSSMSNRYFL